VVSIENQTTVGTAKNPFREGHDLPVPASRAILAGVAGIHSNILSTSVRSFVFKICCKLSPGYISDALGQAVIAKHPVDAQVLNGDNAKAINNASAMLMGEVSPSIDYALVNMRYCSSSLCSSWSSFLFLRQLTLRLSQCLLVSAEKTRIINFLPSGQSGKTFKPNINTHGLIRFWQWLVFNLTGKSYKPFARAGAPNTAGLNFPFKGTVDSSLYHADFRQGDIVRVEQVASLGVGKAVIPTLSPKPGVAWLFTRLHSSEESFEGKVNAYCHILQYLTMNSSQRWPFFLQCREGVNLVIHTKRLLLFFPSSLSLFEKMIVKPAALIQGMLHGGSLIGCRVESVLKGFLMHNYIIAQLKKGGKPYRALPSVSPL